MKFVPLLRSLTRLRTAALYELRCLSLAQFLRKVWNVRYAGKVIRLLVALALVGTLASPVSATPTHPLIGTWRCTPVANRLGAVEIDRYELGGMGFWKTTSTPWSRDRYRLRGNLLTIIAPGAPGPAKYHLVWNGNSFTQISTYPREFVTAHCVPNDTR